MNELVLIALAAFWLTNVVRRLPRIESLAMAGVKPWACNACMSFWTMVPFSAAYIYRVGDVPVVLFLASSGGCFFLLEFFNPPPPQLPPPPTQYEP